MQTCRILKPVLRPVLRPINLGSKGSVAKYVTESGNYVQTLEKEIVQKDGWKILEKVNVIQYWNKWSLKMKITFSSYLTLATGSFCFATYNDGKSELLAYRQETKIIKTPKQHVYGKIDHKNEWDAVSYGCRKNTLSNFMDSVFLPFPFAKNAMPALILQLNPEELKKE